MTLEALRLSSLQNHQPRQFCTPPALLLLFILSPFAHRASQTLRHTADTRCSPYRNNSDHNHARAPLARPLASTALLIQLLFQVTNIHTARETQVSFLNLIRIS